MGEHRCEPSDGAAEIARGRFENARDDRVVDRAAGALATQDAQERAMALPAVGSHISRGMAVCGSKGRLTDLHDALQTDLQHTPGAR